MPTPGKPSALIKPTLDTKFHIDYSWWERNSSSKDLRIYLLSHLLPEHRDRLSQVEESRMVDYIDPDTAEVFQLDELDLAIKVAADDPEYITPQTPLIDSIFRVFLKNNNAPLTPREIADQIERSPTTILKTIGGMKIYKGLRPYNP